MSGVIDLASYRRVAFNRRKDDRAHELALWRVFSGVYVDLCEHGLIDFDAKTLRRLWDDYVRDMPEAIRAREMLGEL